MIVCMDLTDEVRNALALHLPVVALESTIVTHGMPWPASVETARAVEAVVRGAGAVPATIAITGGRIKIGLTNDELHWLGQTRDVLKLSRADLAYALSTRRNGATTVAATMICAHLAGIKVFATGGIGGVHRGAETSLDISADLEELARTDVTAQSTASRVVAHIVPRSVLRRWIRMRIRWFPLSDRWNRKKCPVTRITPPRGSNRRQMA